MAKNVYADAHWLAPSILSSLFLCMAPACGTKVKLRDDGTTQSGSPSVMPDAGAEDDADDASDAESECAERDDGAPCGAERHCIKEVCLFNTCGDGVVAGNEECDDGNEVAGDECNPACRSTPITCGNAHVEAGEECDDGNERDDDACSNGCTINRCGNMRRDPGEECDRLQPDDMYCTSDCKRSACRNGRLDPGEECDDGNAVNNDGCTNDCKKLRCGDGNVDAVLMEECDDGNQVDDDKCSNACTRNECGNKRLDPGEVCDNGASDSPAPPEGSTCNKLCAGFESDLCGACMKRACTSYNGVNLYDPCFVKAKQEDLLPPSPPSATFTEDCRAFVTCTVNNHCADPLKMTATCVCGDLTGSGNPDEDIAACLQKGDLMELKGPCVTEGAKAANNASDPQTLMNNLQATTLASGFAFFMTQCRLELCQAECGAK